MIFIFMYPVFFLITENILGQEIIGKWTPRQIQNVNHEGDNIIVDNFIRHETLRGSYHSISL